jgi:mRNA interferase RelE/StbE
VVIITKRAKRDLEKMDGVVRRRMIKKLNYLKNDPIGLSKTLTGFEQGEYRFRVGDFRVCFDFLDERIVILRIRHRREVYRV